MAVEEHVVEKAVAEMMSRLCMMSEDSDYEIKIVRPEYYLSIRGGGHNSKAILIPVAIDADGSRHEGEQITFTFQIGSDALSDTRPPIKLFDWMRSNPWSRIVRPSQEGV